MFIVLKTDIYIIDSILDNQNQIRDFGNVYIKSYRKLGLHCPNYINVERKTHKRVKCNYGGNVVV